MRYKNYKSTFKLAVVCFLLLITACANPNAIRKWDVGLRYEQHNERMSSPLSQQVSQTLGTTVTMTSGDDNKILLTGYGLQVGWSEYIGNLVSRIGAFYVGLPPLSYQFTTAGGTIFNQTLNTSAYGLEGAIGYTIFKLIRPQISYKYEYLLANSVINGISSSAGGWNFMLGGGVATDIHLSNSLTLLLIADYRVPVRQVAGLASMESWNGQIAIQFGKGK